MTLNDLKLLASYQQTISMHSLLLSAVSQVSIVSLTLDYINYLEPTGVVSATKKERL